MTWFFTTSFTIYIGMAPKSERFTMLINFDSIVYKPLKSSLHLTLFFGGRITVNLLSR